MKYRFYSPVQGIIDYDFNKDMDYDSYFDEDAMEELEEIDFEHLAAEDIVDYQREINQAIRKEWDYETDEDMGLMHYFAYGSREIHKNLLKKVTAAYPRIETVGEKAYGVMVCDIEKPLTDQEIKILKDYFSGQYSDGWGEGFSQRGIETSYGVLYLDFWSDDFYICLLYTSQNIEDFNRTDVKEMTKPLFAIPAHQFLFYPGSISKKSSGDMSR